MNTKELEDILEDLVYYISVAKTAPIRHDEHELFSVDLEKYEKALRELRSR